MGYTAAAPLGKSAADQFIQRNAMSRFIVLIIFVLIVAGGLYFLSTVPEEQPTRTIEVDVPQGGNAN